jgi:hypothetical protein
MGGDFEGVDVGALMIPPGSLTSSAFSGPLTRKRLGSTDEHNLAAGWPDVINNPFSLFSCSRDGCTTQLKENLNSRSNFNSSAVV